MQPPNECSFGMPQAMPSIASPDSLTLLGIGSSCCLNVCSFTQFQGSPTPQELTAGKASLLVVLMIAVLCQIQGLAKDNPKFAAVDRAIGRQSLKVVTLLRLSPLLPLALSNYLYGLTSVDLGSYVLGSWLGMLPGTIAYVTVSALGPHCQSGHKKIWKGLIGGTDMCLLSICACFGRSQSTSFAESSPNLVHLTAYMCLLPTNCRVRGLSWPQNN